MPPNNDDRFRYLWEAVIRRAPDLSLATKGVAFILASYGNPDGSRIFPGNPRLARVLGCSERQVQRHLADLRSLGYLDRIERGSSHRKAADVYQLSIPTDFLDRPGVLDPNEKPPH